MHIVAVVDTCVLCDCLLVFGVHMRKASIQRGFAEELKNELLLCDLVKSSQRLRDFCVTELS